MMRFVKQNTWFPKAYRWSLLSEEMFFQTLAVHVGVTADCSSPTFAKWIAAPAAYQRPNLYRRPRKWHLMARKFVN
jgi:hypothetical protein